MLVAGPATASSEGGTCRRCGNEDWVVEKMSKAFTKETDNQDDDELEGAAPLPAGTKNYLTPGGFARMKDELDHLVSTERPELVKIVAWAASNGDRSENGDYLYGKKRLREIDRRIRFLVKRLDLAEVIDPEARASAENSDQIFFGATVTVVNQDGIERKISIVGVDEINPDRGYVSWISPIARALIKAREGDMVSLSTPGGVEELEIVEVAYKPIEVPPFSRG